MSADYKRNIPKI